MPDINQLFDNRLPPWGNHPVVKTTRAIDVLKKTGLDWTVEKVPMFIKQRKVSPVKGTPYVAETESHVKIPNNFANVRSSDNAILGVVGLRYQVVQNHEAFAFLNELVSSGDATFRTAGSIKDGHQVWILAKLSEFTIAGDQYQNFLFATNSHNGRSALTAGIVPVRLAGQNVLNLDLKGAWRSWEVPRSVRISDGIDNVTVATDNILNYHNRFWVFAERMIGIPVGSGALDTILGHVFPRQGESKRAITLQGRYVDEFRYRYLAAPDLGNLRETAWGVIQAMSDLVYHRDRTASKGANDAGMVSVIVGDEILDKTVKVLEEMFG